MDKQFKNKEWGEFFLEDIGEIKSGKDITKVNMVKGNTPYVSSSSQNNGVSAYVGNTNETLESNCISINRNGSIGYAFYHPYVALFSNDCRKFKIIKNKYISLFISNQIKAQKEKYNYGYKMGTGRIKRQKILLPITDNGKPDYKFMSDYMEYVENELLKKYKLFFEDIFNDDNNTEDYDLNELEWGEFYLDDLFESIQRGKRLTKSNFISGEKPYISSSGTTNGVDSFIGNEDDVRIFENCITLANSGSVGSVFYHPYDFVASDHVT